MADQKKAQLFSKIYHSQPGIFEGNYFLQGEQMNFSEPMISAHNSSFHDGSFAGNKFDHISFSGVRFLQIDFSNVEMNNCAMHNIIAEDCDFTDLKLTNCRGYGILPQEFIYQLRRSELGNTYKETPDSNNELIGSSSERKENFKEVWKEKHTVRGELIADVTAESIHWLTFEDCYFVEGSLEYSDFHNCHFKKVEFADLTIGPTSFTKCTFEEVYLKNRIKGKITYNDCVGEIEEIK
jgi:uncharacterized protein YjbI with pentapeptide repeats